MSVTKHVYLSLWCPYLGQLEQIWCHAALTYYCSAPSFEWCKPLVADLSLPCHCIDPSWGFWHFKYEVDDLCHMPDALPCKLQRLDLDPFLSWTWATVVMDLPYGVYWGTRTQKILIWTTSTIAARCNNLCLCSLQFDFFLFVWPSFWHLVMYRPVHLVIGHVCVVDYADPSRCLSYLIKVVCS